MTYKRITEAERSSLYRWRKEGRGVREIGRRLGRAASRITRELARNLGRCGHPKQSSFAGIGPAKLQRIDTYLNDRPRKCLGWQTPREKLTAFLGLAPC